MNNAVNLPTQDPERARSALWSLDPGTDRAEWVRIGCSAKAAGLTLEDFNDWSSEGGNYQGHRDVQHAWKSFKEGISGGVSAGTLFHLAREKGWRGEAAPGRQATGLPTARKAKSVPKAAAAPKTDINAIWASGAAASSDHPYIRRKGGVPDNLRVVTADLDGWGPFRGRSLKGWLMVPVWSPLGQLASVQFIGPEPGAPSQKLNAMGCPMNGIFTVGRIGESGTVAIVEGIGHAWSIHSVTGTAAVVTFGAANMERAAAIVRHNGASPVLIPDQGKEDQAAEVAKRLQCAIATLPTEFHGDGDDINDLHREWGAEAVQSVMSAAATPEETPGAASLFPLGESSIATMLATAPRVREYIIDPFLPLGVTGALVAPGGTGKSFMLMQLAVAVASGAPLMGYSVPEPAGVLMLAAEDDRDEIHRRLTAIIGNFHDEEPTPEESQSLPHLAANLHIQPRVGDENRLTLRGPDGNVMMSPVVDRLIATANKIRNLKLIILDPVSRFRSGDENSSDDATRLVEACERIRKQTGATVLMAHHTRKGAAGQQDDIRGASAFVDGLRWAATLHKLNADDAKEFGMEREEAAKYLRLQLVKANYVAPQEPIYMQRGEGGKLIQTEAPKSTKGARFQSKADERYHDLLERLKKLIRQKSNDGQQLTKRGLRDYAGAEGVFGVGDQVLRSVVSRAITEGEIRTRADGKRGEILSLW